MTLTLASPMAYRPSEASLDEMIDRAAAAPPGYDAIVLYSLTLSDSLRISRLGGGERDAFTPEEREAVEKGLPVTARPDQTFILPAATYSFMQLPSIFNEKDLPRLLLPFATQDRQVFVRIFHESVLETVMQLFIA